MILDVRCVGNPGGPCVETHRIERGGTVRVSGRNLGRAAQLLFYGGKGERDDALAPVSAATPGSAVASVPASARSGPVAVLDGPGRRSLRWTGLVLDDPLQDFGTYQPLGAAEPRAGRRVEAAPDLLRRGAEGGLHLRRGRSRRHGPAGQPRALQRRSDRAELGSPGQRSRRSDQGDLERKHRRPRPGRGPLRLPHQRARRLHGRPAQRSLRARRRVGLALRTRVPGARPSRLRRRAAPDSARGAPATPTRARTCSPPAARRWSPPAEAR